MRLPGDAGAQWMPVTQPAAPPPKWLQRRGAIIVTPAVRLPGDAGNASRVVCAGDAAPRRCGER
ncbi:hypothetical protein A6A03_15910 [Chloroflexus islandicus]|uniref:Uncharacterized protein n=1 Tax=Chloroflexus islandicus TaxID=1707952 RepID=A0A178MAG0_9CHLR|nr:hypothetical protein A6A03_15910 [Chloroflexus islandicus]